jgi:hypothetical protein
MFARLMQQDKTRIQPQQGVAARDIHSAAAISGWILDPNLRNQS